MTSVRDEPGTRKVYKSDIVWIIGSHQLRNQMMDRRILLIVLLVCIHQIVKQRVFLLCILAGQRAVLQTDKEAGIDFRNSGCEKLLQQLGALLPSGKPSA